MLYRKINLVTSELDGAVTTAVIAVLSELAVKVSPIGAVGGVVSSVIVSLMS